MKIKEIMNLMEQQIYDASNLPDELEVGDVLSGKYEEPFKIYKKKRNESGDYVYYTFSVERIVPSDDVHDYQDFIFTIQNGKAVPIRGYEAVTRKYF